LLGPCSQSMLRAGFEARGLIFGAPLALALGAAFVPLRKPGKLPGETISEEYFLEYGSDKIEMHSGAVSAGQRVVLVDDLIATGGTMAAGIKLMGMLLQHDNPVTIYQMLLVLQ
jgi:adenine phosphoribosyltransferase